YLLVLDRDGELLDVIDTRDTSGAAKQGRNFSVPSAIKRASGIAANVLWDNVEYVLGLPRKPNATDSELLKVAARHSSFCATIDALSATAASDAGIAAV